MERMGFACCLRWVLCCLGSVCLLCAGRLRGKALLVGEKSVGNNSIFWRAVSRFTKLRAFLALVFPIAWGFPRVVIDTQDCSFLEAM